MYVCLLGFDSEMVLLFSRKFSFPHNFGAWKGIPEEKKKEKIAYKMASISFQSEADS